MENNYGQQRRMRPDERFHYQQASRPPRPPYGYPPRAPPPPSFVPPRTHQYRPRPEYPQSQHERPLPARHPDHNMGRRSPPRPAFNPYSREPPRGFAEHRPRHQPRVRQLSHISALTSSQAGMDSRSISEIDKDSVASPTFMPTTPLSPMTVDETYDNTPPRQTHQVEEFQPHASSLHSHVEEAKAPADKHDEASTNNQGATIEALTSAIRQGLGPSKIQSRSTTPKPFLDINATSMRMPFAGEPESPTSIYTDVTGSQARHSMPLSSYHGFDNQNSKPSTIHEQEIEASERSTYTSDVPTPSSHLSTNPIIGGETSGLSTRVPVTKRPPRLDINAVRDAEARGSLTSLSDLIKRATRLATNLDKGKTASRFGDLDFWGSSEKTNARRGSTVSDVINAFRSPGDGSKRNTLWPSGNKQFMASKSSLGHFVETTEKTEKPKRKCCGLAPWMFVLIIIVAILVIAAAVLVPLFLIVLPKMHKVDVSQCPTSHACHNGGISVIANNACSCICVDGYTGKDCSSETDPDCTTASLTDASNTYSNVTIGTSVLSVLRNKTSIPLNITNILSTFANNNLSCASENSLVDFDGVSTLTKRFVIVPGMIPAEPHVPALNLPPSESKEHSTFVMVDGQEPEKADPLPSRIILPRADATQSANGIVFATSTQSPLTQTTNAAPSGTGSPSAATSTAIPSHATKINATDTQLNFAAAVVLYLLETTSEINIAVSANQAINSFFTNNGATNHTVEVVSGARGMSANFDTLQITFANGTKLGGS